MKSRLGILFLLTSVAFTTFANPPARNGLFATLETSAGDICFELLYQDAPRTVANFVTLAEGTRPWFNTETNGVSNEPFYNGRIFHRVVENFVIQAGRQSNFAGPGYAFNDEFSTNARHDTEGVVSMANIGLPNTNGSQFFITLRALPGLDFDQTPAGSQHSVFGRVVTGMNIVRAISVVPTDTNEIPLQPITLETVTIVRQGAAANAFNPATVQPPLPIVREASLALGRTGNSFRLFWNASPNARYWVSASSNLDNWNVISNAAIANSSAIIDGILDGNDQVSFAIIEILTNE